MSKDLVKVCKSADEAKVQKKIFLVYGSIEERFNERILEALKMAYRYGLEDGKNPMPQKQKQLTNEGLKAHADVVVSEILNESSFKEISALEEKIIPNRDEVIDFMSKDLAPVDRYNFMIDKFKEVFQKLRSEAFSLPEKELHEKEGEPKC